MKKIIIFSLIILFFTKTQNVLSNSDTFTVDNIEVSGKTNVQNYKSRHLDIAFRKGFEKLITSIVRKKNQQNLLSTDIKTIKFLLSNYRILEESITQNQHKIKINVTFDRAQVSRFLFTQNISYSEVKKLDILIYPITILNSDLKIFSNNKFFEEWNKNKDYENISFILPVENLDDIDFIKKNLSELEEVNLDQIVNNYNIKNKAVIIFRYDNKNLNVFLKTDLEGIKKFKKISFGEKDLQTFEVRKSIISDIKNYINELWKEENLIDISTPSYLALKTSIKNKSSLKKIIEKIEEISLIDNYIVEQLDNESAKIKIKFFGKIKNLQNNFVEQGIKIRVLNDEWNLYLES